MSVWQWMQNELLGTVTPFCSCSSIPLFMGFTGAGLPVGVTFSFLISSPMVDLGSLVLLTSIFGARVAVVYVVLGLVVAVAGGVLIQKLGMEKYVEPFILSAGGVDVSLPELTLRDRLTYARAQMTGTLKKVFPYILVVVGVPMYADIFGTIPVAEALLAKGAQLGTVLAFMMAVTTLSLPSLIMLRKAVRPQLLALFVGVCVAGIVAVGYLFNVLQVFFI